MGLKNQRALVDLDRPNFKGNDKRGNGFKATGLTLYSKFRKDEKDGAFKGKGTARNEFQSRTTVRSHILSS